MKYSVIIPVFNEEKNIPVLNHELTSAMKSLKGSYEIIYINDGSVDGSLEELLKIRKRDKNVKIIDFRKNFGQSAAMKAGFDNAKGDIIISMDADLQNDPKDIPRLIKKMNQGYDVVSGWRFERHDPLSKRIPSKISNWMHRKVTRLNIHDSGCSLKAYKKKCLENIELYGEMHRYIPAMIAEKGYKVGEVIVTHHPRKFGKSKYGWARLLKGGLDLIDIEFWTRYSVRPLHLFGGIGIFLSLAGCIFGIVLGILRALEIKQLSTSSLPLVSVFLVIIGIQLIILGIISDILIKIYYQNKSREIYSIKRVY